MKKEFIFSSFEDFKKENNIICSSEQDEQNAIDRFLENQRQNYATDLIKPVVKIEKMLLKGPREKFLRNNVE